MPRVVKLYKKSKGGLSQNQGPNAPRPVRTAGLSCERKCHNQYAAGTIDEVGLADCLARCRGQRG